MNRKQIRQMNLSLLRRLTTRPAVPWMEGRRAYLVQLLEEQNYIQRFLPLYDGGRLRCAGAAAFFMAGTGSPRPIRSGYGAARTGLFRSSRAGG